MGVLEGWVFSYERGTPASQLANENNAAGSRVLPTPSSPKTLTLDTCGSKGLISHEVLIKSGIMRQLANEHNAAGFRVPPIPCSPKQNCEAAPRRARV